MLLRNQQVSGSSPLAGSRFSPFSTVTYGHPPRAAFVTVCSRRVHIGCKFRSSGVPASAASLLAGRTDDEIAGAIIRSKRPSRDRSTRTIWMAILNRDERLRYGRPDRPRSWNRRRIDVRSRNARNRVLAFGTHRPTRPLGILSERLRRSQSCFANRIEGGPPDRTASTSGCGRGAGRRKPGRDGEGPGPPCGCGRPRPAGP